METSFSLKCFLKFIMIIGYYFVTTAPITRYCFKLLRLFFSVKDTKESSTHTTKKPRVFDSSLLSPQLSTPLHTLSLPRHMPLSHWNHPYFSHVPGFPKIKINDLNRPGSSKTMTLTYSWIKIVFFGVENNYIHLPARFLKDSEINWLQIEAENTGLSLNSRPIKYIKRYIGLYNA